VHKYKTKELILELKKREEGKKKARVIWTLACQRSCSYCSNKYDNTIQQMHPLTDLATLADRDLIMITGGEPMLMPEKLIDFIKQVREACTTSRIYLYTAYIGDSWHTMGRVLELVDGVHFTLHKGATVEDVASFKIFQYLAFTHRDKKSFRLSVDPKMVHPLTIIPAVWKEVRVKEWFDADNCPVPLDETLHLWRGK